MRGELIKILDGYSSKNKASTTITLPNWGENIDDCSYFFPELYFQGKVPHSIIKVVVENTKSNIEVPYWYITLAVRYSAHSGELEVKAVEDISESDQGFHLQRMVVFKRYIDQTTLCFHKNNLIADLKPTIFSQSEVPCGITLDLFSIQMTSSMLSCPKRSMPTLSIFNAAYMPSLTTIQTQYQFMSNQTKKNSLTENTMFSNEHGFSADTVCIKSIFSIVFGKRKSFIAHPIFAEGIKSPDPSEGSLNVFLKREEIMSFVLSESRQFISTLFDKVHMLSGHILSMLTVKEIMQLSRVQKNQPEDPVTEKNIIDEALEGYLPIKPRPRLITEPINPDITITTEENFTYDVLRGPLTWQEEQPSEKIEGSPEGFRLR